jgi:hypothetical protein
MKGRGLFVAIVAALSLLSATAVAGGHRVVQGTKGDDELTMGAGGQRVFARAGDDNVDGGAGRDRLRGGRGDDYLSGGGGNDRLRGGQDDDLLDGGEGDDYLNGGGDGGDKDRIVCGDGHDVVVLGRNDVVLVEVQASNDDLAPDAGDPAGDDADDPLLEEPESSDDDGCEKLKGPGAPRTCASHNRSCGDDERTCASNDGGCDEPVDEPVDEPCVANVAQCDDPVVTEPEPDEPVEVPARVLPD